MELSQTEAEVLADCWLAVFGQNRAGVNTKAFMWHVFSGGRYPSLAGAEAEEAYAAQSGAEFIVLCNDRKHASIVQELPRVPLWPDCYVFPRNLAWTMAFTHEAGWLGPYFARHRDYAALEVENQAALRKRLEKEAASRNGWW